MFRRRIERQKFICHLAFRASVVGVPVCMRVRACNNVTHIQHSLCAYFNSAKCWSCAKCEIKDVNKTQDRRQRKHKDDTKIYRKKVSCREIKKNRKQNALEHARARRRCVLMRCVRVCVCAGSCARRQHPTVKQDQTARANIKFEYLRYTGRSLEERLHFGSCICATRECWMLVLARVVLNRHFA